MSIFDKVTDRTHTASEKWEKYSERNIIPMWVADSDFETAPEIVSALQARVSQGIFGYSQQPTDGAQDAIKQHLASQYNWDIKRDWIVPLPSLVSGLSLSCKMTPESTLSTNEILTPQTIYPPFKYVIENNQQKVVNVAMKLDASTERWSLDIDALEAAITDQTKLLLFCNPHNPAGTVYTEQELAKVHQICQQHDLLICSDEIHCDLVLDEDKKHIPLATLNDDAANRTITLMAASKTFNVAGLGFGFAIIPSNTLREQFRVLTRKHMPDINILAQVATEAAFKYAENWRLEQLDYLRGNRDYLMQEINALSGLKMFPLEATFLAWIDVSALNLDDPETFFEDAGVGISAGKYFGNNDFIRLNFACRRSLLEEAVDRIKKAINKYHKK